MIKDTRRPSRSILADTHAGILVSGGFEPDPARRVIEVVLVGGVQNHLFRQARVFGAGRVVLEPREPIECAFTAGLNEQRRPQQGHV